MLAYAIYYVTIVNVNDDYSYLTLGLLTGLTALSVIGLHEWFRFQHGQDRGENPIEEYGGAIAVLMGALSAVWLPRFAVFYAGQERNWIEVQEGEVWMPVWLATLQTLSIILVMEISTRSIRRHSLGTLPRTTVILAPLCLAFSAIGIWLDYSRGELEIFLTSSFVMLSGSAILYSLRLDRSLLYLLSSGMAVALPILIVLTGEGEIEHASLLVPAVVMVGITATDRSLSKKMIENGSGVVVSAILFCQVIATNDGADFIFAGIAVTKYPFGLTFWLWFALLVGWFAPTYMQRTPAMPVGLALALALLVDEAALIGWTVGIAAFVYLETRPQARDWVVRLTFVAMVASWWLSAAIGSANERVLASFGGYSLSSVEGSAYFLFPVLLILGTWAQKRGRLGVLDGPPMLLLLASINIPMLEESSDALSVIIIASSIYQIHLFKLNSDEEGLGKNLALTTLIISPIVISSFVQAFDNPDNLTEISRLAPFAAAVSLYVVFNSHREENQSMMLRPELAAIMLLTLFFLIVNIGADSGFGQYELNSSQRVMLTLFCLTLASLLLSLEGGALFPTTPLEKLIGMAYLVPSSAISASIILFEDAFLPSLLLRDAIVASVPIIVSLRTKEILDLSDEARNFGAATLILLLIVGMTDVSGGLLAFPLFILACQRASKHVSTPVLASLPLFAVAYASFFEGKGETIWHLLDSLPYLRESTDILSMGTPRWASLLLLAIPASVAFYMPAENSREGGSRYGSEQLFGPAAATLLAIAFLLPDPKTAPIIMVAALSVGAWKKGVANWFWINPLATVWATSQLIDYINLGGNLGVVDEDFSFLIGGLVAFAQYILLANGKLLENVQEMENPEHLEYLGVVSRAYGYVFILLTGGISGFLPFVSALLAGWDGIRNGLPIVLHISVFLQWATLSLWIDGIYEEEASLLWPIVVGLWMIYISWSQRDPYEGKVRERWDFEERAGTPFDVERDFGLFGSAFFLVPMLPFLEFLNLQAYFGFSIVLLSLHHVVPGFQRDQGWRRMLSLVGMPSGLIITGSEYEGLGMVVMLFLASLTLIGQAVLYASRGGLEIGSTIEGATPFMSDVGVPSVAEGVPKGEPEKATFPSEELEILRKATLAEEPEAPEEDTPEPSPLFLSDDQQFGIRLDPPLIENLHRAIEANQSVDFSKWSPVLGISSNGAIVLNWERLNPEEE